jgi:hypothetical protein
MNRITSFKSQQILGLLCLLCLPLWGCGKGSDKSSNTAPPNQKPPESAQAPSHTPFEDVTQKAGINFVLGHQGRSPLTILETLGNGCAFLDYDGDGWQDILLIGSHRLALYHNEQNGTFKDVTAQSGMETKGEWQGIGVGDYDNDGKVDVYISGYRTGALYQNEGDGKFRNVTQAAGINTKLWGASAAFVDVDNDGYLDLVVANYVKFYPDSVKFCKSGQTEQTTCGPTTYDPERPTLYHNNKNGTFTDETKKRGLTTAHGNALGIAIADYDGDGWIDIAIENDQLPGDLFHNKGKGIFENVSDTVGTSYDVNGNAHAGMGVDWADVDGTGRFSLVVTTYQHQPTSLYMQTTKGLFTDECFTTNVGQLTVNYVGFGIKFLDYDNDGNIDILTTNGHAVDNISKVDSTTSYPQPTQLLRNKGGAKFEEVNAGKEFSKPLVGRGLAVGDFDNDGKPDALIVDIEGSVRLLRNQEQNSNHWIGLDLQGTKSNKDAIGTHVTIEAGGKKWIQVVSATGSFMSSHDKRILKGLEAATKADKIEILWSSGKKTVKTDLPAGKYHKISEAE